MTDEAEGGSAGSEVPEAEFTVPASGESELSVGGRERAIGDSESPSGGESEKGEGDRERVENETPQITSVPLRFSINYQRATPYINKPIYVTNLQPFDFKIQRSRFVPKSPF